MRVMKQINSLEEINNIINTAQPVLIYFSAENCSVCEVLKPKVNTEIKAKFDKFGIYEIKANLHKEIASKFSVFSIPTMLVYFDKKEFFRYGRNVSLSLILEEIRRPYELFYK